MGVWNILHLLITYTILGKVITLEKTSSITTLQARRNFSLVGYQNELRNYSEASGDQLSENLTSDKDLTIVDTIITEPTNINHSVTELYLEDGEIFLGSSKSENISDQPSTSNTTLEYSSTEPFISASNNGKSFNDITHSLYHSVRNSSLNDSKSSDVRYIDDISTGVPLIVDSTASPVNNYASDTISIDEDDDSTAGFETVVRKCCPISQYFSTLKYTCTSFNGHDMYVEDVSRLLKDETNAITYLAKTLQCVDGRAPSLNQDISNVSHVILSEGDIFDTISTTAYDHSHYCLELVGVSPEELKFTLVYCHKEMYFLKKCCQQNRYFDMGALDCLPIPISDNKKKKLIENFNLDNNTYASESLDYFLFCQNAVPAKAFAADVFFETGHLCLNGYCYDKYHYCIDYEGDSTMQELRAVAYYCPINYFIKCCDVGDILDGNGCVSHSGDNSLLLKQIMSSKSSVLSFNSEQCKDEKPFLIDSSSTKYIQWWTVKNGSSMFVKSADKVREITNYCIDDLKEADENIQPIAFVCESDLIDLMPTEKSARMFKRPGSLGKCCPKSFDENIQYAFSSVHRKCTHTDITNITMKLIDYFSDSNVTKEHFHGFPKCDMGYHTFPLASENGEYATLTTEGDLKIISMASSCVESETVITNSDFCFEYILTATGDLLPSAFICPFVSNEEIYDERFALMTTLLAISCICLFAALIFLFTMKVRRGIVTVQKVHTLAGRILVSFVGSHLLGFIALAVSQHENALNNRGSSACFVLSGWIQFFNLATFCWNTSICLESLLLTINIHISEWMRYFLHSLWAWGFPLSITILTFVMDANRDKLPCGVITPKIGVHHCFLFDTSAKLLYFYLPILITLTANIFFIVGAKALRTARLKKLAKGNTKKGKSISGEPGQNGKPAENHGMRIHQSQATTAESLRLVLWTGGTWFLELAGFVMSRYILPPKQEAWYYYLWYIPSSLNALRGVGIFAIIVFTPEVRARVQRRLLPIKRRLAMKLHKVLPYFDDPSKSSSKEYRSGNDRSRMSLSSMLTSLKTSTSSVRPRLPSLLTRLASETRFNRPTTVRSGSHTNGKQSAIATSQAEECEMVGEIQRKISRSSTLSNLQEE